MCFMFVCFFFKTAMPQTKVMIPPTACAPYTPKWCPQPPNQEAMNYSRFFSISAPIDIHTLYNMNSASLVSFKCFHFFSPLFFYRNPSHCHFLPRPGHSLPMTVLFLFSSPLSDPFSGGEHRLRSTESYEWRVLTVNGAFLGCRHPGSDLK